ncbi:hypothetical protein F5Y17DRAFT_86937 [Xylariaceae sp. FL0594]|nr:hypothetical protein F5Y17DRAFT_86937 [Xylariaceae sp. FL0594]
MDSWRRKPATSSPTPPNSRAVVYYISAWQYLIGMFLPTITASIIAVVVRIVNTNAMAFQPWNALAQSRGAQGGDSVLLEASGWKSLVRSFFQRPTTSGRAVVLLTALLNIASQLLIPLPAEAIALDLRGAGCVRGARSAKNCAWVLSKSTGATITSISLLALMILGTLGLIIPLVRWRSGVFTNPWSISTLAALSADRAVRQAVQSAAIGKHHYCKCSLERRLFKLESFRSGNNSNTVGYGVVMLDDTGRQQVEEVPSVPVSHYAEKHDFFSKKRKQNMPFFHPGKGRSGMSARLSVRHPRTGHLLLSHWRRHRVREVHRRRVFRSQVPLHRTRRHRQFSVVLVLGEMTPDAS